MKKILGYVEKLFIKEYRVFVLILWLTSLIPIIPLGYGSDGDAWSVAGNAQKIWLSREYSLSRTTGFPLFELAVTPLVNYGEWYLSNIFSVVFGLILCAAVMYLGKAGKLRHLGVTLFLLLFLPIIFKNSASTMDYIPALAMLLWAYVWLVEKKWLLAALFIGISCGFRPTSCLFVIPAMVFVYSETKKPLYVTRLFFFSCMSGMIAYSPVLLKYGIPNPYGSIKLDTQTIALIAGYNAFRLFGIIQTFVIGAVLVGIVRKINRASKDDKSFFLFHFLVILVWGMLFVFLPDEPEYLLPIVPSVIFILDRFISKRLFVFVAIILLSYHFVQFDVLGGQSGERYIDMALRSGFTVRDVQDRIFKLSTREAADRYVSLTKEVLMYGNSWIPAVNDLWIYDEQYMMYRQKQGNLFVSGRIRDKERLNWLHSEGFRLVVWRGEIWEYLRTEIKLPEYVEVIDDLSVFFGVPIRGKAINQR